MDGRTSKNIGFTSRKQKLKYIKGALQTREANILIVYGRRRIGKTELIEHSLRQRNLLKLEGVEGGDTKAQMYRVLFDILLDLKDEDSYGPNLGYRLVASAGSCPQSAL